MRLRRSAVLGFGLGLLLVLLLALAVTGELPVVGPYCVRIPVGRSQVIVCLFTK